MSCFAESLKVAQTGNQVRSDQYLIILVKISQKYYVLLKGFGDVASSQDFVSFSDPQQSMHTLTESKPSIFLLYPQALRGSAW